MSSTNSPILTLDVRARRAEGMLVATTLACAAAAPWTILETDTANTAVASLCFLVVTAVGFLRAGWLGGRRRIVSAVWAADGRWLLRNAHNRECEVLLHSGVRLARRCIWLCFYPPGRSRICCSMLLTPSDLPGGEFRRLSVRLRIEGTPVPARDAVVVS